MKFKVITVFCIFTPLVSMSQDRIAGQQGFQEIIETILAVRGDEVNPEQVNESLIQLTNNPVNINKASGEDLSSLLFLSSSQIDSLLAYRLKHGSFLSIEEMHYVDGFTSDIVRLLQPFLTIEPVSLNGNAGIRDWLVNSKKSLVTRYSRQAEKPEGYNAAQGKKNVYLGNPDQYMMRFRIAIPDNISMGFAFEKDKGEPMVWAPAKSFYGFDHYSYHFALLNRGILKNLTLGDYKILFGQGLVLGNGFYFGKSSEPIASVRSRTAGIRPYSGSGESGFFRGAASELQFNKIAVTTFISYNKIDSRIDQEIFGNEQQMVIRSFLISGLHRTLSEIDNRKNNREFSTGYHINYKNTRQNFSLGSSGVYTNYSMVYRESPVYYNQFDFKGQDQLTMGIDYYYYHRKFNVFGETAASRQDGWGLVNGVIGNISKNIETAIHFRYFSPSFHSFYGNPFRESSAIGNESGIYWGLRILPVRNIIMNLYLDVFRFPWLKYNLRSPSSGNELFTKILFNPVRNLEIYGQFLRKTMDASLQDPAAGITGIIPGIKQQYWGQFSWKPGDHLQLRTRVQFSTYKISTQTSSGMAAFQDLGWNFKNCSVHSRILWFRTDNYVNRQYIFEQGVLYDYQVPSFYGKGTRLYFIINMKAGRFLHFWAAAGRTFYSDINQIGTGTELIRGNHRTEFQVQCELKF